MASKDSSRRSGRPPAWFLMTLGAGAASGVAWLVARYRRDRLVAQAGAVAHPHDDALTASAAEAAEAAPPQPPVAAVNAASEVAPGPFASAGAAEAADAAADAEEHESPAAAGSGGSAESDPEASPA
ncbi:MAG: hypothetical protein LBE25_05790 [Arthrobacter sp.]|nr:hypothetical protein [Arthrobacter sp.]